MKLYIDLDGVLADFFTSAISHNMQAVMGFRETLATNIKETRKAIETYPKGLYQIEEHLGITTDYFWSVIDDEGEEFWSELALCEGADDLWQLVKPHNPVILTSPSMQPDCVKGKLKWIQKHYGEKFRDYIFCPAQHKYRLAEPGAILVDDREQNCTDWEKAGGTAILWPHLGNNSTQTLSDAMVSLRDALEKQS